MTNANLGFDTLTDDQLVELARALATELAERNPPVVDAAKAAVAAATARRIDDQDNIWLLKKWLAKMVDDHLHGRGWALNVWTGQTGEVRVYLERAGSDRRGRESEKYCLWVTGGSRYAPDTLTYDVGSRAEKSDVKLIKMILRHAAQTFPAGVKIDVGYAAGLKYETPDEPQDVADHVATYEAE
jgi:hypothetical protein